MMGPPILPRNSFEIACMILLGERPVRGAQPVVEVRDIGLDGRHYHCHCPHGSSCVAVVGVETTPEINREAMVRLARRHHQGGCRCYEGAIEAFLLRKGTMAF